MFRFQKNDKYTSIAVYAFCVLALLILAVAAGTHFPRLVQEINNLLAALRPLIYGFVFAYICSPIVRFAERFLLPKIKSRNRAVARVISLLITYFVIVLVLAVLVLMIVPQVAASVRDLTANIRTYLGTLWSELDAWIQNNEWIGDYNSFSELISLEDVQSTLTGFLGSVAGTIGFIGGEVLTTVGNLLIGIILSAYILYHKDLLIAFFRRIMYAAFPRRVYRAIGETLVFADRAFGQFIIGSIFDSLIVGTIAFVVLAIFKMPYYPLVAAILGITNIIPAFGPIIGAVPSFLIIFISDPTMAFWFLLIELVIQQVNANFISPRIISSTTGIATVWVITAIMLFGAYFGAFGWFIGVPLFSVIYRVVGDLVNRRLEKKKHPVKLEHYRLPLAESGRAIPDTEDVAVPAETERKEETEG